MAETCSCFTYNIRLCLDCDYASFVSFIFLYLIQNGDVLSKNNKKSIVLRCHLLDIIQHEVLERAVNNEYKILRREPWIILK